MFAVELHHAGTEFPLPVGSSAASTALRSGGCASDDSVISENVGGCSVQLLTVHVGLQVV